MTCRVLVLQQGVRSEPPRWETQVQDVGSPEDSQPYGILISKNSPKGLHLNTKTWQHIKASKLQCWTSHNKQLAKTGTQSYPLTVRLPEVTPPSQTFHNTPLGMTLPLRETRSSSIHQKTGTSPLTKKLSQHIGPTAHTRGRLHM